MTGHELIKQLQGLGDEALRQEAWLDTPMARFAVTGAYYDKDDEPDIVYIEGELV